jgi:acetoin utilization deacetylase AcuC-like enzyme
MNVGWVYHRRFLDHQTGKSHVECPERLEAIVEALEKANLLERLQPLPFAAASPEQLSLVHDPAYVDIVRVLCDEGFTFLGDASTAICEASYDVALLATGGVVTACEAVMAGTVDRAFCAVRPPGHHAGADQAMGFCLFNHVAVAAEHLVRRHRLDRIAIVDLDVHHGNGTQNIFAARTDVFYVSMHESPDSLSFPGTGHDFEVGIESGRGATLNVPLDRGGDLQAYLRALEQEVVPALDRFEPQFLLLSTGFDALAWDDVANMALDPEAYGPITERLTEVADRHAAGRLVSVLEGGYHLGHLGAAVAAHVDALLSTNRRTDADH